MAIAGTDKTRFMAAPQKSKPAFYVNISGQLVTGNSAYHFAFEGVTLNLPSPVVGEGSRERGLVANRPLRERDSRINNPIINTRHVESNTGVTQQWHSPCKV